MVFDLLSEEDSALFGRVVGRNELHLSHTTETFAASVNTVRCTSIARDTSALQTLAMESRTSLWSYRYRARQKLPPIEPNFWRAGSQSVRRSPICSAEPSVLIQCE